MKYWHVDAFTRQSFSGNPAGVCIHDKDISSDIMQNIAAEMKHSETAFLSRKGQDYSLRWFTPETEVELCGHATLASAHILWESGILAQNDTARFHTLSGPITAHLEDDIIFMDFPAEPAEQCPEPDGLSEALGIEIISTAKNRFDYLVEAGSEEIIRSMTPDFNSLKDIPSRGFIVTAGSDLDEYDFVSRFFAPGVGVDEDPVTGSAHCCLGPWWEAVTGKKDMTGLQLSLRGGEVLVRNNGNRVYIGGRAITVVKGEIPGL